ncbi:uncharacterized protein LOC134243355, partial [Saccostrea cucullata]|uniref:uncharacterized protein LOC134243355 n=1 Tax=Saccostrea cuccullata TaxID=36930 RepID=UPI002ED447A5
MGGTVALCSVNISIFLESYSSAAKPDLNLSVLFFPDTYPKIYGPKKINRSPTALLEALEESVGHECRSYGKFSIDDPACYHRQFNKAEMMLSTASGRKAARMMMSMYPQVFEGTPAHIPVEPPTK